MHLTPTAERLSSLRQQRDALTRQAAIEAAARTAMHAHRLAAARAAGQRDAAEVMTYAEITVALAELDNINETLCGEYVRDTRHPTGFVSLDPMRREYLRGVADVAAVL